MSQIILAQVGTDSWRTSRTMARSSSSTCPRLRVAKSFRLVKQIRRSGTRGSGPRDFYWGEVLITFSLYLSFAEANLNDKVISCLNVIM